MRIRRVRKEKEGKEIREEKLGEICSEVKNGREGPAEGITRTMDE